MPEPAPGGAASDPAPSTKDPASEREDESTRDREADRLAELADRVDPVPPEVTKAARRVWSERLRARRRDHPEG